MGNIYLLGKTTESETTAEGRPLQRPSAELVETPELREAMGQLYTHPEINRLLDQLYRKDAETYFHCHRVADWAQWVGGHLGVTKQERVELYLCGLLHDVGKLMTPNDVLKKPGALSNAEFAVMKLHSADSGLVVRRVGDLGYLEAPIRGHHERIDGRGYPDNLKSEQIHLYSRVILVSDTFDAMTSDRVYRKGLAAEQAYEELLRFSGTQFDPDAARAFIKAHQVLVEEKQKLSKKAA